MRGRADRLTGTRPLQKHDQNTTHDQYRGERHKLDLTERDLVIKQQQSVKPGVGGLHVRAPDMIHDLLQEYGYPKGSQDRYKQVLIYDPEYHRPIDQPPDDKQNHCGHRNTKQGVDATQIQCVSDITAEDDKIALRDIDHIHDPPQQGHAIGNQRKDRAHEQSVQQQLHRKDRRDKQDLKIFHF